jgi:hypothetical protein
MRLLRQYFPAVMKSRTPDRVQMKFKRMIDEKLSVGFIENSCNRLNQQRRDTQAMKISTLGWFIVYACSMPLCHSAQT